MNVHITFLKRCFILLHYPYKPGEYNIRNLNPLEMITEIHSFQSYIPYREHIIDEVIRVGIKINEVRSITPTITFNNYIVNNILKNSIHIKNDKNNINP